VEYEDVGCTVFNLAGHPAETRALHLVIAELIEGSTKLRGAACQSDHLRSWRFAASVLCQAYGIASRLGSDYLFIAFLVWRSWRFIVGDFSPPIMDAFTRRRVDPGRRKTSG
jgi:hypothetical protein